MVGTAVGIAVAGLLARAAWGVPAAMGGAPRGERAERVRRSPQFRDGKFRNEHQTRSMPDGDTRDLVRRYRADKERRKPHLPIPLVTQPGDAPRQDGLFVTWYGHASTLVEIDGARVLFDPVWSDRVSPSARVGPRRLHPAPVSIDQLPALDAIVISHDHYDHLDLPTVRALLRTQSAPFVVPLGIGAHLERWQVPAERIVELDWNQSTTAGPLRLTATPAQHFSGRGFSRDGTLWASWVVAGPRRRVFYSGDTGYFDGFARIGAEHGPFDVSLVQIGAYDPMWPDIHMTPEEGVATHMDVHAHVLIPVHWATFTLAPHAWSEPVDRLWREAKAQDVTLVVPKPGERVDIDSPQAVDGWWQAL
nr:Outer membrane protein romA [Kibdelosporangium sp. MJ126-NF4]CTQ96820.1 Outer membrane protein romA [Kibdelosporangium sp. MJ126-NF4]